MKRDFVKPLIIMTPKSLLRSELASSRDGGFHERTVSRKFWARRKSAPPDKIEARHSLLGQGLLRPARIIATAEKITNAAIVRMEQLYPLAEKKLRDAARAVSEGAKVGLVPGRIAEHGRVDLHRAAAAGSCSGREITYAGRNASASPAVGALAMHKREQACVIAEAFSV